jgi:hypothetical protein
MRSVRAWLNRFACNSAPKVAGAAAEVVMVVAAVARVEAAVAVAAEEVAVAAAVVEEAAVGAEEAEVVAAEAASAIRSDARRRHSSVSGNSIATALSCTPSLSAP